MDTQVDTERQRVAAPSCVTLISLAVNPDGPDDALDLDLAAARADHRALARLVDLDDAGPGNVVV